MAACSQLYPSNPCCNQNGIPPRIGRITFATAFRRNLAVPEDSLVQPPLFPLPVERAVTLEDLPFIGEYDGDEASFAEQGIVILVDGYPVRALIHSIHSWSERIYFKPDGDYPSHLPLLEEGYFQTKHFRMETPGVLEWAGGQPFRLQWP